MAINLGKRKRRAEPEKPQKAVAITATRRESSDSSSGETTRALFRRAFEAKFKPLPKIEKPEVQSEDSESDDEDQDEDDWSGLSDEEAVEVVKHILPDFTRSVEEGGKKAFMVSRLKLPHFDVQV
jgi:hypothetical protein